MPQIQTYQDASGDFRCRVVADNGEIVLPLEGHKTPQDAEAAFLRAHRLVSQEIHRAAADHLFVRLPRAKEDGGGIGAGEKPRGK